MADESRNAAAEEVRKIARERVQGLRRLSIGGEVIIGRAELAKLSAEEARDFLDTATRMIDTGTRGLRVEMGESETKATVDVRSVDGMTDEDLQRIAREGAADRAAPPAGAPDQEAGHL